MSKLKKEQSFGKVSQELVGEYYSNLKNTMNDTNELSQLGSSKKAEKSFNRETQNRSRKNNKAKGKKLVTKQRTDLSGIIFKGLTTWS